MDGTRKYVWCPGFRKGARIFFARRPIARLSPFATTPPFATMMQPLKSQLQPASLQTSCTMPRIDWVEDEQATGPLGDLYAQWKANNPGRERMPGILKSFSARPDFLRQVMDFSYGLH